MRRTKSLSLITAMLALGAASGNGLAPSRIRNGKRYRGGKVGPTRSTQKRRRNR